MSDTTTPPSQPTPNHKNGPTLLTILDDDPPFLIYVLARDPETRKWPTLSKLSERSGLPERTIVRVASKISWKGVKVEVASAFLSACGVQADHPTKMRMKRRYLAATMASQKPFPYLTPFQRKVFERRCAAWNKSRAGLA